MSHVARVSTPSGRVASQDDRRSGGEGLSKRSGALRSRLLERNEKRESVGVCGRVSPLMFFRRFRLTCRALFVVAALGCALPTGAFAAGKDAQAESAYKKAMEEDYLDTKFDDAEKKLNKAIEVCGEKACSPKVKAKLYMGLGIVLAGGKNKLDEAKESFAEGLKLDPTVVPDPDYVKSEIKFAFDEAKKSKGKSSPGGTGGTGGW